MTDTEQHVVIIGAGIGGLMCALALHRHGIRCTLLENDPAPPAELGAADSMRWVRKGVPQALHPHFFMGRLRLLIAQRYPALLDALRAAGAGESEFTDYLHPIALAGYRPRANDENLRSLNARRTTFEMVVRDYVRRDGAATTISAAKVTGFSTEGTQPVRVTGVNYECEGEHRKLMADVFIDASGRFTRLPESLGLTMNTEQFDSGLWYFTRHYRRLSGQAMPEFSGLPAAPFADFIVGALPADNGAFTVTFQIYREDKDIAKALREPAHFQAMCMQVAKMRPWVDPAVAEPTSDVYGFGQMDSFWRRMIIDGAPQVLGLFCVGDSCVRSNPKFGRGCTWTSVAAHNLADILANTADPAARISRYETMLIDEFRADWETMRSIDVATEAGFCIASGRKRGTLAERLTMRFDALINKACVIDASVFREVWTSYHGLQSMKAWMARPAAWLRLFAAIARLPLHAGVLDAQAGRPTRQQLQGGATRIQQVTT